MSNQSVVVLKFGGSVLLNEQHLRRAVHEVYRWRREGNNVVVIVSALAGRTEELVEQSAHLSDNASDHTRAALISTGEFEAADLLFSQLDRAGVPSCVLHPKDFDFIATGPVLDANPDHLNTKRLSSLLDENGVVVIPGFVAVDSLGSCVTLGRGGSDLSAIFIASQIHAKTCRLIKDVDGLYDQDPSLNPEAKRFVYANYDDALSTDGTIIQHKAVQAARKCGVEFELGTFNSISPSQIGSGEQVIECVKPRTPPIQIALCGLGTVGQGVFELLQQLPDYFHVSHALCQSPEKHKFLEHQSIQVVSDFKLIDLTEIDVVVELVGGTTTAHTIARKSIDAGCHLVTANKSLIAEFGDELMRSAVQKNVHLQLAASVGGSVPVLETLRCLEGKEIQSVSGVLNGTANYILCALEHGGRLEDAIEEAQRIGFAEADPTRDVSGQDSMDKLLVISQIIGWNIDPNQQALQSIHEWSQSATEKLYPVRHLAQATPSGASVRVTSVPNDCAWGQLQNEWNGVLISCADGSEQLLRGKGAGRYPTSESVLADLLEIHRLRQAEELQQTYQELTHV